MSCEPYLARYGVPPPEKAGHLGGDIDFSGSVVLYSPPTVKGKHHDLFKRPK